MDEPLFIRGVPVQFPPGKQPYGPQLAFMAKVLESCQQEKHALLEAPTGTGKSLAMLCSVLAWQASHKRAAFEAFQAARANAAPANDFAAILSQAAYVEHSPVKPILVEVDGDDDFKPRMKRLRGVDPLPPTAVAAAAAAPSSDEEGRALPNKPQKTPKVYIASRTHAQLAQLIKELRSSPYRPSMVVLGSRDQYCVNPKVTRGTGSKNLACKKLLQEPLGCSYKHSKARIYSHISVQPGGHKDVWDIEDLVDLGRQTHACPYFASRAMLTSAELVFCPYNYILDPSIRKSLSISIADSVVVFDEAHNIESMSSEMASLEFELSALEAAVNDLRRQATASVPAIEKLVGTMETLAQWLVTLSEGPLTRCAEQRDTSVWEGAEIVGLLDNVGITAATIRPLSDAFTSLTEVAAKDEDGAKGGVVAVAAAAEEGEQEEEQEGSKKRREELDDDIGLVTDHRTAAIASGATVAAPTETFFRSLFTVLEFLFQDNGRNVSDYKFVIAKKEERRGAAKRMVTHVSFWCMSPAVAFASLRDKARCVILASGTLSPMDSFATELDCEFPVRLETSHVIDADKQLWAGVMPTYGAQTFHWTFGNSENVALLDALGAALLDVCRVVPKGVLCFFSSYSMVRKVEQRWHDTGLWTALQSCKLIVTEPQSADSAFTMDQAMAWYYAANGAQRPTAKARKFSDLYDAKTGRRKRTKAQGARSGRESAAAPAEEPTQTGGLFLAVCRGKASEGIDFADENARAVVLVGIPYPNARDLRLIYKKRHNDARVRTHPGTLNGSSWYSLQAFRALNQAIGRSIRHRRDFGSIILLDQRFNEARTRQSVSRWIRPQIQNHPDFGAGLASLASFFSANQAREPVLALGVAPSPPVLVASSPPAPLPVTVEVAAASVSPPPSQRGVRVCCKACFRPAAVADESLTRIEVRQRYVCDMWQHLESAAEPVAAVQCWQVTAAQLTAAVEEARDEWVRFDGIVFSVLRCACGELVGVTIRATEPQHNALQGQAWLLERSVNVPRANNVPV